MTLTNIPPVSHLTSPAERERRYQALRAGMEGAGLSALIICSRGDEFVRGRVQYVSDIFQWAGRGFVVLPLKGSPVFVVDPLWGLGYASLSGWIGDLRMPANAGAEIGAVVHDLGIAKAAIGIVGLADITASADERDLRAALPEAELRDATDLFDDIRAIKSEEEIANLYETSAILRTVFKALEAEIRPGVTTERHLMAQAHRLCRQYGCMDGIAIMGKPPFRSFGPGTDATINRDDVFVIDLEWGGPSGYWVELRRCFSFGPPSDQVRRFYDMQVDVFAACVAAHKAGSSSEEVAAARERAASKYGYTGTGILAYTAHGIGVDSLEPPWVPGKERILQENMVLNLHPNLMIPDEAIGMAMGGVSLADNVLVAAEGGIRMTDKIDTWIALEA